MINKWYIYFICSIKNSRYLIWIECVESISLFFINRSKLQQGTQIRSVFWPDKTEHRLNVNVTLCKSTLWQKRRLWNSRIRFTWSEDENKIPSNLFWKQSEPWYIPIINSFIYCILLHPFKNSELSNMFSHKTNYSACIVHERLYKRYAALCWTVFIFTVIIEYSFNEN